MSKHPNMNNYKPWAKHLGYSTWLWVHLPGGAPRPEKTWTDLRVPVHPTILQVFQADTAWWCQKVPKIEEDRSTLLTISYQCQYTFSNILHTNTCFQYTRRIQHSHTNVIYLQYLSIPASWELPKIWRKKVRLDGTIRVSWLESPAIILLNYPAKHQQNLTLHHAWRVSILHHKFIAGALFLMVITENSSRRLKLADLSWCFLLFRVCLCWFFSLETWLMSGGQRAFLSRTS